MITFIEHETPGYAARTYRNCEKTNLTLAIGFDYNTAGEILTEKATRINDHPYMWIQLQHFGEDLEKHRVKLAGFKLDEINVNVAGNGIYTVKKFGLNQKQLDNQVEIILFSLFFGFPLESITSGGQTGTDEAALKYADKHDIPAICCFPKDWLFRNINAVDVKDRHLFLKRFHPVYNTLY